jgi:hypothetical protein
MKRLRRLRVPVALAYFCRVSTAAGMAPLAWQHMTATDWLRAVARANKN